MKTYQQVFFIVVGVFLAGLIFVGMWLHIDNIVSAASLELQISDVQSPVVLLASEADEPFRVPARRGAALVGIDAATITINYIPAGSTDLWGESCYDWPAGSQDAFNYAASLWEAELNSIVPIEIDACWADLPSGVLGYSGALSVMNFSGAPMPDTYYTMSLANALASSDLNGSDAEMHISYSGNDISWYFGIDGATPIDSYDFVSVVLHEICHGLNFFGEMTVSGDIGSWGDHPDVYDQFAENGSNTALLSFRNNSTELGTQLTSNSVYFNGANTNAANGGAPARLYAPSTWQPGSSYSHLDEIFNGTDNALMTYSIDDAESLHDPGNVTRGILLDMGWSMVPRPTSTPTEPLPTSTPTEPLPTSTPTEPLPTSTPTEPLLTSTPTEPLLTSTPTEPSPPPTLTKTLIETPFRTFTPTPTTCPAVRGYVRLNNSIGPGLAGVEIYREVSSVTSLFATTDSTGFYTGVGCGIPGMTFWPELDGYRFEPEERIYDMAISDNDFVAFPIAIFLPLLIH